MRKKRKKNKAYSGPVALKQVLNAINDAVIITDITGPKGRITKVNKAALKLSGYKEKELVGRLFTKLIVRKDKSKAIKGMRKCLRQGFLTSPSLIMIRTKKGETVPVLFNAAVLKDIEGEIAGQLITFRDTRTKKEAGQRTERQIEEPTDLERMKIEFLNITSHELKSPLTPIMAYLDLLLKGELGKLTESQKDGLEVIARNTKRLKHLIWDILDLAKIEAGEMKFNMQQIQLRDVIEGVVKDTEIFARERDIGIGADIGHLPLIEGDKERLTQVFTNLVNNAIKFTPKRGKITIRAEKKGYNFIVSVRDTGIGIAERNLGKIFDKFYQVDTSAKRKYPGTGLGLTICNGIIKAHGGEIEVESEPRKGSIFYVTLPYRKMGKPVEMFAEAFRAGGGAGALKK